MEIPLFICGDTFFVVILPVKKHTGIWKAFHSRNFLFFIGMRYFHNSVIIARYVFFVGLFFVSCRSTKVASVSTTADSTRVESAICNDFVFRDSSSILQRIRTVSSLKVVAIQFLPEGGTFNLQTGEVSGVVGAVVSEELNARDEANDSSRTSTAALSHTAISDSTSAFSDSSTYNKAVTPDKSSIFISIQSILFWAIAAVIAALVAWRIIKRKFF